MWCAKCSQPDCFVIPLGLRMILRSGMTDRHHYPWRGDHDSHKTKLSGLMWYLLREMSYRCDLEGVSYYWHPIGVDHVKTFTLEQSFPGGEKVSVKSCKLHILEWKKTTDWCIREPSYFIHSRPRCQSRPSIWRIWWKPKQLSHTPCANVQLCRFEAIAVWMKRSNASHSMACPFSSARIPHFWTSGNC